jgi:hypothetical protein
MTTFGPGRRGYVKSLVDILREQCLVPAPLLSPGDEEGIRTMTTIMPAVAELIHFPEGGHAKRDDKIRVHSAASEVRIMWTLCNLAWRGKALRNFSFASGIEIDSIAQIQSVQQAQDELSSTRRREI